MNRILTIVSVLVFLLIVGISPPIVADFNSSQHTALILFSDGNITNSSQHLLVKNNGSSNVLYFIDDQGSGLRSEVFAIRPNSTQNINLAFSSPAEVMQLVAFDFSSNLRISNM